MNWYLDQCSLLYTIAYAKYRMNKLNKHNCPELGMIIKNRTKHFEKAGFKMKEATGPLDQQFSKCLKAVDDCRYIIRNLEQIGLAGFLNQRPMASQLVLKMYPGILSHEESAPTMIFMPSKKAMVQLCQICLIFN